MPNDDYTFDYGNAPADDYLPTSPGSTAPQTRIVQDAPTVQMHRPAAPQQNPPHGACGASEARAAAVHVFRIAV